MIQPTDYEFALAKHGDQQQALYELVQTIAGAVFHLLPPEQAKMLEQDVLRLSRRIEVKWPKTTHLT